MHVYLTLALFVCTPDGSDCEWRHVPWYGSMHECILFWQQEAPKLLQVFGMGDRKIVKARCSAQPSPETIG